jgi:uncharacterized Fe-S cluster protein YjdI
MDPKNLTKEYSNGEVTVVWKPGLCIHSGVCFSGLPRVFNPKVKPWVNVDGASTEQIVAQVKQCPSGALSFYYNDGHVEAEEQVAATRVVVRPNGPLVVYGSITIKDRNGLETQKERVTAFCRCGHSRNKPFCDGSHSTVKFRD